MQVISCASLSVLYLCVTTHYCTKSRPMTGGRQPLNVDEYCFCYLIRNTVDIIPYLRAYDVQVRMHRRWGVIIEEEKYAKRPLCMGIKVPALHGTTAQK